MKNTLELQVKNDPCIWSKDHVVLGSLSDLKRLCNQYNIPLMHMSRPHAFLGKTPAETQHTYFTFKSGMYYTYIEQSEEIEGVSS